MRLVAGKRKKRGEPGSEGRKPFCNLIDTGAVKV